MTSAADWTEVIPWCPSCMTDYQVSRKSFGPLQPVHPLAYWTCQLCAFYHRPGSSLSHWAQPGDPVFNENTEEGRRASQEWLAEWNKKQPKGYSPGREPTEEDFKRINKLLNNPAISDTGWPPGEGCTS